MFKVGLTGGIASGKSTVCRLFAEHGIPIIDADVIAKKLVEPKQHAYIEITKAFGQHSCLSNGQLNRDYLRQLIFTDNKAKLKLESILHPLIREQLIEQSNAQNAPYCILDIPLLIESKMNHCVNHILIIDINLALQIRRLCDRDQITEDEAQLIISQQATRQQRLACADDVISNDNNLEQLKNIVDNLHKKYLSKSNNLHSSCQQKDSHGQ